MRQIVAPLVAPERLTLKVSLASTLVSPLTTTEIGLGVDPGVEVQLAALCDIVAVGRGGGAVRGREVDVEGGIAAGAGHREGLDLGAVVAFGDR